MDSNLASRWARRWGPPAGLCALVLLAALIANVLQRYADLTTWTVHAHEVIAQINAVESRVDRIETAGRGYLLTRDPDFLNIHAGNRAEMPAQIGHLRQLLKDNPGQLRRLDAFQVVYERHFAALGTLLRERPRAGSRLAPKKLESLRELAGLIRVIHDEEARLLRERTAGAGSFARTTSALMLAGVLLAVFLVLFASVSTNRISRANEAQAGLLRSIFDSIGDGLIVTDMDGRFTHHNRGASQILGVSFDKVHTIAELGFITGMPEGRSPTRRAMQGESTSDVEFKITRDGGERTISADGRPVIGADGRRAGALAIVRDVTERRNLENEWKRARESALEASRLKSDFLATMSHEIRTPMNGVIGMSTILLDTPLDEEQLSFVNTIKCSADSLLALINQVLDHARIESGKLQLIDVDFDLFDTVETVTDLFRYLARSKAIDLRVDFGPEVPGVLRGDVDRLRQVLVNLVGNALKFTDHGFVEIVVRRPGPVTGDGRSQVQFTVRDTGCGMSPGAQKRLFQKFSQVGDASSSRGGSGLGLAISRELVRAMGGDVDVQSVEGFGSRFRFSVSLGTALTCPVRGPTDDHVGPRFKGRVLVAEDQPVNQLVIAKYLERFGLDFDVVPDGEACLRALGRQSYDLVLMDCQMRPMDGYQATARIRAAEVIRREQTGVERRLPIVALTAEGMSGDRRRCFEMGMDAFLSKPLAMEHLKTMLKKYLPESAAEPTTFTGPEFDPEVLRRLDGFESDGRPLALVLYDEFRASGLVDLEKLVAAAASQKWADVRYLAHSLKSSGRTLGLEWFGEVCETLERVATGEHPIDHEVARLQELHRSGCAILDQTMGSDQASNA